MKVINPFSWGDYNPFLLGFMIMIFPLKTHWLEFGVCVWSTGPAKSGADLLISTFWDQNYIDPINKMKNKTLNAAKSTV